MNDAKLKCQWPGDCDPSIANASSNRLPTRVLLILSSSNALFNDSWLCSEAVIPIALDALQKDHLIVQQQETPGIPWKTLVKKNYGLRIYIIFDIFHTRYDPQKGHLLEANDLPVLVAHFGGRGVYTRVAETGLRDRVNRETAEAHNLHGWAALPPFETDHTKIVPMYMNPRDITSPELHDGATA